jgi:hypothetical protein
MVVLAAAVASRPNNYDTCACGATKRTAAQACRACQAKSRTKPVFARFWEKVDRSAGPDACWLWTGTTNGTYGSFFLTKRRRGGKDQEYAHRVAYALAHGRLPATGLHLDHLCSQPLCVNVAHLELVTPAENLRRSRVRRAPRTSCRRGHDWRDPRNVYLRPDGRRCAACLREAARAMGHPHVDDKGETWQ